MTVFGITVGGYHHPIAAESEGRKGAYFAGRASWIYKNKNGGWEVHVRRSENGLSSVTQCHNLTEARKLSDATEKWAEGEVLRRAARIASQTVKASGRRRKGKVA